MFVVWRGWGLMALVAIFLPLASCGGLIGFNPGIAMLCAGVTLFLGGLVCRYYGRMWNQGTGFHSLYGLSLETWGWIYLITGGLLTILSIVGLLRVAIFG